MPLSTIAHAPSSACARHVWTRRRVHVVSTCPRGRLFALPSAATTSSSSSGGGGTAADHARPTAPALEAARGRVCASELDAHRAPCVRRSGPLRRAPAGRVGMSGRSVERRIRDPVSCRESLYITFRPPVHSVAALVRVGRVSAITPNPTCTLLLTPPVSSCLLLTSIFLHMQMMIGVLSRLLRLHQIRTSIFRSMRMSAFSGGSHSATVKGG